MCVSCVRVCEMRLRVCADQVKAEIDGEFHGTRKLLSLLQSKPKDVDFSISIVWCCCSV